MAKSLTCVVVGDGAVGKTSLLISYATNKFPVGYVPTVFDHYNVLISIAGSPCNLQLVDTAGQEDFDCLRPLCYNHGDVFLICFSVTDPDSFANVKFKWIPEIEHHRPNTPYLIVGTKSDCRGNASILEEMARHRQKPITQEMGKQLAQEVGAVKYVECSALSQLGLKDVFDEAIIAAYQHRFPSDLVIQNDSAKKKMRSKCCFF